jgi:2-dehydro-3-deoxyphosphogluconate aldolase/(4S)-4-hydroxy-2-oxoglutarate aldolase
LPNTSEPDPQLGALSLLRALHHQPLLVVLRAEQPQTLLPQLQRLERLGVRHVELAWSGVSGWAVQVAQLVDRCPGLSLGVASVCRPEALEDAAAAGLRYAVSPVLDEGLIARARALGLALVPGVMTPSEVHRARQLGCPLVKLYPAVGLGAGYWRSLQQPLGGLPGCIAAGGLGPDDVEPWLAAGVDAVALGGALQQESAWAALAALLQRLSARPIG